MKTAEFERGCGTKGRTRTPGEIRSYRCRVIKIREGKRRSTDKRSVSQIGEKIEKVKAILFLPIGGPA